MQETIAVSEVEDRHRRSIAAYIYNALDLLAMPNQCLSPGIRLPAPEMKIAGPAFTVHGVRAPRSHENHPG